jgi:hypothetical protein
VLQCCPIRARQWTSSHITEIERENQLCRDRYDAAEKEAGVDAALEAIDELIEATGAMERAMLSMRATTLAGFQIRGMVLQHMLKDRTDEASTTDELTIVALIRDLVSIQAA